MKRAGVGRRERREQPLLEDDRHPVQPGVGAAQQNPRDPVDLVVGRRPACLADRRGRLRVLRLFGASVAGSALYGGIPVAQDSFRRDAGWRGSHGLRTRGGCEASQIACHIGIV
jgi:hypothetical protein